MEPYKSETTGPETSSAQNGYYNQYYPANNGYPAPAALDYDRRYKAAARRVQKKLNFYKSLTSYVIVCSFLWVIAIFSNSGYPWPIWVMLGWGVGLAFQAVDAFAGSFSETQRQQMIEEELRRSGR